MYFIAILLLTTLSIAGSAAFFSIYGLANIFEGAFWPVVVMATSLEAGKLVAASYVYRYWSSIKLWMKTYLISAILILMLITSAGIFGYLSAAYQQDTLPLKALQSEITLIDERKTELDKLKQERYNELQRLDNQIAEIPGNHSTNRRKMREAQKPQREQINLNLKQYNAEITRITAKRTELKGKVIQQEAHTGPIVFIAKAMGNEIDDATKWMIFLIIFAFDPLAVILTIATNMAMLRRKEEMDLKHEKEHEIENLEEKKHEAEQKIEEAKVIMSQAEETAEAVYEETERLKSVERTIHDQRQLEQHTELTDEPEPKVNSIGQLKVILDEMNQKTELTQEELQEKGMIEEMLAKKIVKEKIRNPQG